MTRTLPSLLTAGLALALFELVFTWARGRALFLTTRELAEYAVAAFLGMTLLVTLLGAALLQALRSSQRAWLFAGGCGAAFSWLCWLLSAGRRVVDHPLRPWVVLALGLAGLLLVRMSLGMLRRFRAEPSLSVQRAVTLFAMLGALACLLADAWVLPRGYPPFHAGLFSLALFLSATSAVAWPSSRRQLSWRGQAIAASALLALAPLSLIHLAAQPNASYAVHEKAPFTAKMMRPFTARAEVAPSSGQTVELGQPAIEQQGVDLRERDVLLITVDALRADTLRALGGKGLTPSIDALAEQGAVFARAYTPAPHTSYALASLLTSKFIKQVVELGTEQSDHPTLPDLLKRYGYRTAAFYPPAIFFVDGARFSALSRRGFGFEYRKEMYASAEQRVEQLKAYLAQADTGHPLFVWVHLFEPHEPYDPPAEFARSSSPRGRYDGEVAYADRAIGQLVAAFRGQRSKASVIVSADHGEEFGDHGGSFHGSTLYDEQTRVPVVWSSPDAVPAQRVEVPIELVDLGSTILASAGIPRDPRMRGDDLSAVLLGKRAGAPRYAFSSVEERQMVCDGRYKAICSAEEQHCQLFDLLTDPHEQQNLATRQPERVTSLRRALFDFLGSIPRREAVGVQAGVGFPEPLARARLGAPGSAKDVLPLLEDGRPTVRAASARVLGELMEQSARDALGRLAESDPDASVRAEAAVSALTLGAEQQLDAVAALLASAQARQDGLSLARRAALALAMRRDARAITVLAGLARDESAQEVDRLRAVEGLGKLRNDESESALIAALSSVRLREAAASALGEVGGPRASDALYEQLSSERYPPARAAEAAALLALGHRGVVAQVQRFLGMESSIPNGVSVLLRAGALRTPSARGAEVSGSQRRGGWECNEHGCSPGEGARLQLPATSPEGRQRITVLIAAAQPGTSLVLAGQTFTLTGGAQQLSFWRVGSGPQTWDVRASAPVTLSAWVSVRESEEIPPPAPEPWDGGAEPEQHVHPQ